TPISRVTLPASRNPPVVDSRVEEKPFLDRFCTTALASSWFTMAMISFIMIPLFEVRWSQPPWLCHLYYILFPSNRPDVFSPISHRAPPQGRRGDRGQSVRRRSGPLPAPEGWFPGGQTAPAGPSSPAPAAPEAAGRGRRSPVPPRPAPPGPAPAGQFAPS